MPDAALPLTTFGSFSDPRISHGVTTRAGGVSVGPYSSLNLGMSVGDDPKAVAENKSRLANALGFEAEQLVTTPQVHGNTVLLVDSTTAQTALQVRADILIAKQPGFLIMQRYADCVPILLWHPDGGVVSVAHAGWRGTVLNVSGTAAAAVAGLGGETTGIRAGIGPSIGPCCFEVGEEVVAAFPDHPDAASIGPGGRPHLDLWEINRRQLAAAGIPETQIELSGACTRCQPEIYFSHRALGYPAGRFGAAIGLRSDV
jgi:YfiH family protein